MSDEYIAKLKTLLEETRVARDKAKQDAIRDTDQHDRATYLAYHYDELYKMLGDAEDLRRLDRRPLVYADYVAVQDGLKEFYRRQLAKHTHDLRTAIRNEGQGGVTSILYKIARLRSEYSESTQEAKSIAEFAEMLGVTPRPW